MKGRASEWLGLTGRALIQGKRRIQWLSLILPVEDVYYRAAYKSRPRRAVEMNGQGKVADIRVVLHELDFANEE
jgi:hypothetical protein